jgi:protein tyrosine/serine phosphatase
MGNIANFGKVTDNLYRGAQPDIEGFATLKGMGVSLIVDVRSPYPQQEQERRLCYLSGLGYEHIYWRAQPFFSVPDIEIVRYFLWLLKSNPDKKIFVHCKQGSDRTGVCVAAERIALEGWASKRAANEMGDYGYHWYLFPRWKGWVANLKPAELS